MRDSQLLILPIFETASLLAFNKPSGLPSASTTENADSLESRVGGHLLHRLDTGTSGIVLFAKNKEAYDFYRNAFKNKTIQKFYTCLVDGDLAKELSISLPKLIDFPIGNSKKSVKRVVVLDPKHTFAKQQIRGKPYDARTWILGASHTPNGPLKLEIKIETGVRHQIRAHLANLGIPILGDTIYGPKTGTETSALATSTKYPRLMLHAHKVILKTMEDEPVTLQVDAPF